MVQSLEVCKERYVGRLSGTESVGISRLFLKVQEFINPERARIIESVYKYLRIMDDYVDLSSRVEIPEVRDFVRGELRALEIGTKSDLQAECLFDFSSSHPIDRQDFVIKNMRGVMRGWLVDLSIRDGSVLLPERKLNGLNFTHNYTPFAMLNELLYHRPLTPNRNTVKIFKFLADYGNLKDLREDLDNGLVLVSLEDIEKFGIRTMGGFTEIDDNLLNYSNYKKELVSEGLVQNSHHVFRMGLPFWLSFLLYSYLQSRALKIRIIDPLSYNK